LNQQVSNMRFLKNKIARAQGIAIRQSRSPSEDLLVKYEDIPVKTEIKEESIHTKSTADQDLVKTEDDEYSFLDNRLKQSQSVCVKMEKIEEMYNSYENMVLRSSSVPVNHSYMNDLDHVQNSSFIPENQIIISNQNKRPSGRKNIKNKNFIKNVDLTFIKAILAFANSHISLPHVKNLLQQENVKFTEFTFFIGQCQECAGNGLQAFRQILIIDEATDDYKTASLKRIFKALSEVFIREHSLSWISQSRLTYKEEYINYRFKMLQKIQNPVQYLNSKEKNN